MSTELEITLPKLYAGWLADVFDGPIPPEHNATCLNCAMLAPSDAPAHAANLYYHPQAKCCTYIPELPNFLVGSILNDDDPALAEGRAALAAYLQADSIATPLWLNRTSSYDLKYDSADQFFGRMTGLRCPYYLDRDGGLCSIWRYREAVCTTFFCKHTRGVLGKQFWDTLKQLLVVIERDLVYWCALELGIEPDVLLQFLAPSGPDQIIHLLELEQTETQLDFETQRKVWGQWAGREAEYFQACARLVESLTWADITAICGPELGLWAKLIGQAHQRLLSDTLPEHLRLGSFQIVQLQADFNLVQSYINTDLLKIPQPVWEILPYFDGRPTTEAIESAAAEKGVRINPSLVRKLVDFQILVPGEVS